MNTLAMDRAIYEERIQLHAEQEFRPSHELARKLGSQGHEVFPVVGLASTAAAARVFHRCISEARLSHGPFGPCVHLYEPHEYEQFDLFVDQAGLAGIALNGSEMVSMFHHRSRVRRGVSPNLLALGTALGGNRFNAFDTVLPRLYAKCGFCVVARLAWNDEFAPSDWDYHGTSPFNGGRPDVAFMTYGAHRGPEQRVSSFSEGLRVQAAALTSPLFEAVQLR